MVLVHVKKGVCAGKNYYVLISEYNYNTGSFFMYFYSILPRRNILISFSNGNPSIHQIWVEFNYTICISTGRVQLYLCGVQLYNMSIRWSSVIPSVYLGGVQLYQLSIRWSSVFLSNLAHFDISATSKLLQKPSLFMFDQQNIFQPYFNRWTLIGFRSLQNKAPNAIP